MLGFLLAAATAAVLYALTAFYPPQSEDWIHLEILCRQQSWLAAFDLPVSHSRPVWFVSLWVLLPEGFDHPERIRAVLFGMHAVIAWLVGVLARALGASPRRALLTVALFLCFPTVKGLAWLLAISTPEHVMLMLVALIVTVAHARRPRAATGVALLVAQVLAVGSHSAAAFLPFCVAVMAAAVSPRGWRVLLDPWLIAEAVVGSGLVLLIASLPATERYHTLRSLAAIGANGARALLSLLPETLRAPAIEGLRGAHGAFGSAFGFALCAATAAAMAWVLWRADRVVRALLLIALIDLVPPVLTAGFVIRYAYFPAAVVAVALLLRARPTPRWIVPLALLAAGWIYDTAVDVAEIRAGGDIGIAVVESARRIREEVGPTTQVVLVDPPGEVGAERDVPVFNWGLQKALTRLGVAGPWRIVRTRGYMTNTDVELLPADAVEELASRGQDVRRWDPSVRRFVRLDAK
ncbi:MAG: hypothetical protein H6835_06560 [Planctomycetes bacterium]|nr:hypothetical protein [Planctomycetota bacterium]